MSSLDIILPRFYINVGKYRYTPKYPKCQRHFPFCVRIFFKGKTAPRRNVIKLTYFVIPSQLCWRGNLLVKGC